MARSNDGGFTGPIEGLPELIAACNGKENVFASMVGQEFHPNLIAQVRSLTLTINGSQALELCSFKKNVQVTHTVLHEHTQFSVRSHQHLFLWSLMPLRSPITAL